VQVKVAIIMLRIAEHVCKFLDSRIDFGIVVRVKEVAGAFKPLANVRVPVGIRRAF